MSGSTRLPTVSRPAPLVGGELASLLTELGLDPEQCRLTRRPSASGSAGAFLCLPSVDQPQLLAPLAPPGALLIVDRHSRSAAARMAKQAVAFGLRTRMLGLLPVRRLVVDDPGMAELVAWLGGEPSSTLGVLAGPPRANRKPVLRLMSPGGATTAYAKVGGTPIARELVHRETEVLREIATAGWRSLRVPALLRAGQFRGRDLLVTAALAESADLRQPSELPVEPTREIASTRARVGVPLAATPVLTDTDRDLGSQSTVIADLAERLRVAIGDLQLPLGCSHGDWAPWNMAWTGGVLDVWDWERFAHDVPQGFDAIHFAAARVRATEVGDSEDLFLDRLPGLLAECGFDASQWRPLLAAYLLTAARRYAADLAVVPVAAGEARLTWVLRLLAAQTDQLERE